MKWPMEDQYRGELTSKDAVTYSGAQFSAGQHDAMVREGNCFRGKQKHSFWQVIRLIYFLKCANVFAILSSEMNKQGGKR